MQTLVSLACRKFKGTSKAHFGKAAKYPVDDESHRDARLPDVYLWNVRLEELLLASESSDQGSFW
jgi:hypothetical protein